MNKRYLMANGEYVQDFIILNRVLKGKHIAHVTFTKAQEHAFEFNNEKQWESVNWLLNQAGIPVYPARITVL